MDGFGNMMERKSQVLEVEVEHDGEPHRASYFVEDSTIYTNIDGHMLIAPLGHGDAATTVKMLLAGHLRHQARKLKHAKGWSQTRLA
jgi:hypothetical protein